MKVLHYLTGLPPVRGGGLVKYAVDLIEAESEREEVSLLIPGKISRKKKKRGQVSIHKAGKWKKVNLYYIWNRLPIPMANGIRDIEWYTHPADERIWMEFIQKLAPEVIHVHTFMGLHKEFLSAAKKCGIPVVFTTHDYFGICPKADLYMEDGICTEPGAHCEQCCKYAFDSRRLLLEQSRLYSIYRHWTFMTNFVQKGYVQKMFKNIRSYKPEQCAVMSPQEEAPKEIGRDYQVLLNYYREMFRLVCYFHFNSYLAREVYETHLGSLNGKVVSISNCGIQDHRKQRSVNDVIRLGYFGGDTVYKGWSVLRETVGELREEGIENLVLCAFGNMERGDESFCHYFAAFFQEEMDKVFDKIDILVIPSEWMETFAMVAIEAISYGVPVLMTENVGAAKIISSVPEKIGIVAKKGKPGLKEAIRELSGHPRLLEEMNQNILKADLDFDYSVHITKIIKLYEEACDLK